MEKQGNIIQILDAHKTLRFFEEYREVPIEHHWRGSPLRGRRTLAEMGRGTYTPGQSRVPSLVTLTSKGQPCPAGRQSGASRPGRAASERQWSRVRRERGDCLGPEWNDIVKPKRTSGDRDDARMTSVGRESFGSRRLLLHHRMRIYISIATACNGITFTTKYNTLSTDHDKGEFIPDCCIASREAPPAYTVRRRSLAGSNGIRMH